MKPEIFSEIGSIEKVIVHAPGDEHNHVLPIHIQPYIEDEDKITKNKDFLLFDDIIDIKLAKEQHQTFKDIINFYRPDSCIELSSLFNDKQHFNNWINRLAPLPKLHKPAPTNLRYT